MVSILALVVLVAGCDPATTSYSPPEAASPPKPTNQKEGEPNYGLDAWYAGKRIVEKTLTAPSSAKFSSPLLDERTGYQPWGFEQWKVGGFVDAQNAFGTYVRHDWLVVIRKVGTQFVPLYVNVGGEEVGVMPDPAAKPADPLTPEQIAAAQEKTKQKKLEMADKTLKFHMELAEKGDAYGLYRMGERYLKGDGVEQDEIKGRSLLSRAAGMGQPDARRILKDEFGL